MSKLTIAVLGAGPRALGYMAAIQKLEPFWNFCAIVEQNPERASGAARQFGVPKTYPNLRQLLAHQPPDVVVGLTPTDSMAPVLISAARAGCHIISEIPVGITRGIGQAIARIAQENHVRHEVAENVWLWPQESLKQQLVRQGLVGPLTHARLSYPCGSYHGFNGVRMILRSEARRVLGYEGEVQIEPYSPYTGIPMTTRSIWETAILSFENGVDCIYEMPPKNNARTLFWDIEGRDGYIGDNELVLGRGGDRQVFPFERVHEDVRGQSSLRLMRVATDPPVQWENPYFQYGMKENDEIAKAAILMSMHRAVTENVPPSYGAQNAMNDMELWFAIRQSAERGNQWVNLPLPEEPTALERRIHEAYVKKYGYDPVTDAEALLEVPFTGHSVIWDEAGWL